jgi:hypothetical protein
VVIDETPALKKYLDISEESNDEVLASHVNSVLIAPISYNVSRSAKIVFVLFWIFSICISIIVPLLLNNFNKLEWYFKNR